MSTISVHVSETLRKYLEQVRRNGSEAFRMNLSDRC